MNRTIAMLACCIVSFLAGFGVASTRGDASSGARDGADMLPAAVPPETPQVNTMAGAPADSNVTRREPQFENDYAKAWKSIIMPDQPLKLHRHENGRALIALSGGPLDVVDGNGKVIHTYNWEKGKAYWLEADPPGEMHADVNRTGAPIEVIVVELKPRSQQDR